MKTITGLLHLRLASLLTLLLMTSGPRVLAEQIDSVYTAKFGQFSCALSDRGRVKCWGDNTSGQLGQGTDSLSLLPKDIQKPVSLNYRVHGPVRQLALGGNFACALMADGQVLCWGDNENGQLGVDKLRSVGLSANSMGAALKPVRLGTGTGRIVQIAAGNVHACAVFDTGRAKCWGSNESLQLGFQLTNTGNQPEGGIEALDDSQLGNKLPSVNLGPAFRIAKIALGTIHTCALSTASQVKCWGSDGTDGDGNPAGMLGFTLHTDGAIPSGSKFPAVPLSLRPGEKIEDLQAGSSHNCVLVRRGTLGTGEVRCWGANYSGQLGLGDSRSRGPVKGEIAALKAIPLGVEPGDSIRKLSVGFDSSCVLLQSGRIKCWGSNEEGFLGTGFMGSIGIVPKDMGEKLPYLSIAPGLRILSFSTQSQHGCAIVDFVRQIKCWGSNFSGEIGLSNDEGRGRTPDEMGNNLPYLEVTF